MAGEIILPGTPPAPKGMTQVFGMASPRGYIFQVLVTPEGHFVLNSGDSSQPPGHQFIMNLWAREDIIQLRNALNKAINHGRN